MFQFSPGLTASFDFSIGVLKEAFFLNIASPSGEQVTPYKYLKKKKMKQYEHRNNDAQGYKQKNTGFLWPET